jgi:hypothetical protein
VTGLNDAVRREGLRWHACTACGRDWPFPAGHHEQRDWRCHACLEADVARELRALQERAAAVGRLPHTDEYVLLADVRRCLNL